MENIEDVDSGCTDRDLPVDPELQPADRGDLAARLGLDTIHNKDVRACADALILSLLLANEMGYRGVSYARDRNRYFPRVGILPDYWQLNHVTAAADWLERFPDLFVHIRQEAGNPKHRKGPARQSLLRPGPKLLRLDFEELGIRVPDRPPKRILVRDAQKRNIAVPDQPVIRETEAFFRDYDAAIEGVSFDIRHRHVERVNQTTFVAQRSDGSEQRISTKQRWLTRIFSEVPTRGGRLFHGFWETMPRATRPGLQMDGGATYEHDFRACHLRLAFFGVGIDFEAKFGLAHDPYILPQLGLKQRRIVKHAVQIMLNADSRRRAEGAIAYEQLGGGDPHRRNVARRIMALIKDHFPELRPLWYTGVGLELQFVESEIVRACLEELLSRQNVGLPVHDSIIVPVAHEQALDNLMRAKFDQIGRDLTPQVLHPYTTPGFRGRSLTMDRNTSGPVVDPTPPASLFGPSLSSAQGRNSRNGDGLVAVVPLAHKKNGSPRPKRAVGAPKRKKAARYCAGAIPQLVSIKATKPWLDAGVSRSTWFRENPNKVVRQCLAAKALVQRNDQAKLAKVQRDLRELKALRANLCEQPRLPVDDLIDALERLLP